MEEPYAIELEPEVRAWFDTLTKAEYRAVELKVDRLADQPTTLGEPWTRHLDGPVRELRFRLNDASVRIGYWLAPGRRLILLTVFHKTRMREKLEVDRVVRAQKECESEHDPATHTYDRVFEEEQS
ncbi:MAG: addiction module toxin RelE [Nocardia sp.]|uniref:type II toxin-antitoxin system RelE/ParE family toxin n=1 Tax=Nocardia sp. TaxID=1821 RepID=UPI00260D1828|nr:type II toxin-antitoxin system RelE/ParE family toxin [Nocardia sp.]MCU1647909.1 addiction module toxin RelE [Nocardia sp.]